jgi:site-specific DNA-methyltransferase (adenine-specific)
VDVQKAIENRMSDYTLYLGDCLEYMKSMPDKSVDAVITDPPYGVGIEYSDLFDDTPDYARNLMSALVIEGQRIAKVVLFPSGKFENELWLMQNFPPIWRMCWYKGAQSTASAIGFSDWEMIMVYGSDVFRYAHDYMAVRTRPADNGHPCPKDIHWATWLINKFTDEGNTIFDPFMGSGTTGVACMQLGRNFIGCEIDPDYYAIAEKHIKQAAAQMLLPLEAH